ncbi:transcriptional regulator with XRE-family HTH domain [Salinibacter ruber]|uniref:helix-turn-helix domain-containing protein n=1 Tax=Salinibacter ruber TaxID=146919 RepID=UPI00216928A2|nr:helix-turn-helix transcriptional regulator [Salinibacter ruber]MCS3667381.1 transcriptional regulator with XRE-family HTH domain [Salinibacter ruber]
MPDLDALGDTIRELREIRGWSIRDLSERAGVARAPICKYENNNQRPSLSSLAKIAAAFDARPSELLDDAGL